jgi:hypothetical protein
MSGSSSTSHRWGAEVARRVSIPEAEVARLGSEERIGAHYGDELSLNELLTLVEKASALATRGASTPVTEREKFLRQREAVLAQGDRLASRSLAEVSPLLRDELARARAEWQRARAEVLQGG